MPIICAIGMSAGSPWEYWVERMEAARHAFVGLVNAEPSEVAVTTSVSAGGQRAGQRL